MSIGEKLAKSRLKSNLSQEAVAEVLGVSRQSISNWENSKSYPDILNIISLSKLYSLSLDELLADDEKMLKSLEESTNITKSKAKLSRYILIGIYLIIWVILISLFWLSTSSIDGFGYSLITFYIVLPITTFVLSILIGKESSWGNIRFLMPVFFGIMYMLVDYTTFSLANMIYFDKLNIPDFSLLISGAIISYIGLLIGLFSIKSKTKKS